eukprot:295408_1
MFEENSSPRNTQQNIQYISFGQSPSSNDEIDLTEILQQINISESDTNNLNNIENNNNNNNNDNVNDNIDTNINNDNMVVTVFKMIFAVIFSQLQKLPIT